MTSAVQKTASSRRAAGRGWSICVAALFGLFWLYNALKFDDAPGWTIYAAFGVAVVLFVAGIVCIRSDRKSGAPKRSRAARVGFIIVVALEVAAILAAISALQYLHLSQYIVAALSAIVALHFLPLAKIFRARIYYAMGLTMLAATAAAVVLLRGEQQMICIAYSAGTILWLAAFISAVQR